MLNSLINNLINLQETKIRLINKKIKCQIFLHNKSNNQIYNNLVKMFIKIRTKLKINILTMKILKINMIQNMKIIIIRMININKTMKTKKNIMKNILKVKVNKTNNKIIMIKDNTKIKGKKNIKYKICNRIIIIKDKINKMHKIINNKTNFKNKIKILKINTDIK